MTRWNLGEALRRLRTPRSEPFDTHLAPLTKPQADALRKEISSAFREQGYEVDFVGTRARVRLRKQSEVEMDLIPLVDGIRDNPSSEAVSAWSKNFVAAALAIDDASELTTAEIYRALRLAVAQRIPVSGRPLYADHEFMPTEEHIAEARSLRESSVYPVSADMMACLALNTGLAILPARLADLEQIDDVESLLQAARGNTAREIAELDIRMNYLPGHVDGVTTNSWTLYSSEGHLASALLDFEAFAQAHLPGMDLDSGALVAVPLPTTMLIHEVTSGRALAESLHSIASAAGEITREFGRDMVLSPLVHLWHNGRVTSVSTLDAHGNYIIAPDDYLTELLHAEQ